MSLEAESETATPTHTAGKHAFHDLYNAPDASPYMVEMKRVGYEIGSYAAAVACCALDDIYLPSEQTLASPLVLLELCAGYGLSMAPLRTTRPCVEIFEYYSESTRPTGDIAICFAQDRAYFSSAPRKELPPIFVVGIDIADNALAYGKAVGLFDATVCRNLEEPDDNCFGFPSTNTITAEEANVCAPAKLVMATGAFSYITPATLERLFAACSWSEGNAPVFLFFPLVATDVSALIAMFRAKGLDVFYEPTKHWFPQRRFADDLEAAVVTAAETEVLQAAAGPAREAGGAGKSHRPRGARKGHLHATLLAAGAPGVGITGELGEKWAAAQWMPMGYKPGL